MLCTSYDNLQDDVADPLGISMQNVGYQNPAFAGVGADGGVINLQDDRADSFSSAADEGAKQGRLNKWYLFSMIFDRVLLIGFIIMIIVMLFAYGTMRD